MPLGTQTGCFDPATTRDVSSPWTPVRRGEAAQPDGCVRSDQGAPPLEPSQHPCWTRQGYDPWNRVSTGAWEGRHGERD